jgi:hypothetical protein
VQFIQYLKFFLNLLRVHFVVGSRFCCCIHAEKGGGSTKKKESVDDSTTQFVLIETDQRTQKLKERREIR